MEDRDDLSTYPKGWMETLLGNIVNPSDKKVEPSTLQQVPYVGLEHIEKNTGKLLDFGNSSEVKSTKSKFYPGDLLYGKLRPYLNKVHCVNFEGVCSTDILVFSKQPYISNEFLSFRFLCKDFVSYASQNVNGVQHPRVNFQSLSEFPIHLPPLNEQRRIVAKIEALKARSQRVKEALEDIPQLLDQFRQSVLAAAFRGDLTVDWREQNPDVEPASVLLERIRAERRRRWEEGELEKMRASGKTPKDDNWKEKYKEPEPLKDLELPELPEGWCWVKFDQIGDWFGGGTPTTTNPNYWDDGAIPWVSPKDMKTLKINDSEKKITELGLKESTANLIQTGSLLFVTRSGILRHTLPVALNIVDVAINQDIKALKPLSLINSNYLLFASLAFQDDILHSCSKNGTTVESIELSNLRVYRIPLPPLEEQIRIVEVVESYLSFIDGLEKIINTNFQQLETFTQSILAKAFRGELVPQDPDDEPASVLLERIRAEREKLQTKAVKKSTPPTGGRRSKKALQQEAEPVQLELGLE
jgi:type I restriction enzyme S subunit